jgi:hypothetical protein
MMPTLISGPVQVSIDIDVYLHPLLDELLVLWAREGIRVWEEHEHEYFNLQAMLFVMIQGGPALGSIFGQVFKGYNGCVWCTHDYGIWLKHFKKVVYMSHHRFLRAYHPYWRNKKAFDGTIEIHPALTIRNGEQVFQMIKNLKIVLWKGKGSIKMKIDSLFKMISLFWSLPYWKDLMVCHAIDVMHVEKNVCETLVSTLLDIHDKTKHTLKARMNLEDIKLRKDLHHKILENVSKKLPTTCYTLSKQENMSLCNCLHGIKVLSGYSANV